MLSRTVSLIIALLPTVALANELTFDRALEQARGANETILAARADVEQRQHEFTAAKRLVLPRVDAAAKSVRIDGPITIDLSPIRSVILQLHPQVPPAAVPPFTLVVQDETFNRASLSFTQPLYTGGKITAAQNAARAQLDESEEAERAASGATTTELARRYFAVILAERVVGVRRDVVATLGEHQRHAVRLEEEGLISHAERLNADVAVADAERQLIKAAGEAKLAREALASTLALDSADAEPTSSLFIASGVPSELLETDVTRNPLLGRAAAMRRAAAAATSGERASAKPSLAIAGSRELYEADLTVLEPSWSVAVGLSWSLFDPSRGERVAASRSREHKAQFVEQKATRDVALLLESQQIALTNAQQQFRTSEATLDLARENLRVRTRAFEEGFATSLDVVDARLARARVEIDRLSAAYDFDSALASLLEARGESDRYEDIRKSAIEVR